MEKITPYGKAFVGAIVAGLNVLYQALDSDGINGQEWIAVAIAVLTTGGLVFSTPNRDPQALHQDESVQPPEAGNLGLVLNILVVVLLIFAIVFFAQRI